MENADDMALREVLQEFEKNTGKIEKNVIQCCGLTFTQCNAIMEIGKAGCISLKNLADLLEVDNSTMSQTISNLVKINMVERETDKNDRRYVTIVLTDQGIEAFRKLENGMNAYYAYINSSIPEEKKGQVIESLRILNSLLVHGRTCK